MMPVQKLLSLGMHESHDATVTLYTRLTDIEIAERRERREGTLLGLFPERQQYEFRSARSADGAAVFYGPVSETLDTRYMADSEFARSILLKPATATFVVISTIRAGVLQRQEWVLEDIQLLPAATD
jgi:hypothetical protein